MADVKLRFDAPLSTAKPVELRFGAPLVAVDESNLSLNATLPAPTLSGSIQRVRAVMLAATLPAPTMSAALAYNNAVYRGSNATAHTGWQVADKTCGATDIDFQSAEPLPSGKDSAFQSAQKLQSSAPMQWQSGIRARTRQDTSWQDGIKVGMANTDHQADMIRLRNRSETQWQDGLKVVADTHAGWQDRFRYPRPELAAKWADARRLGIENTASAGVGKPTTVCRDSHWQPARKPPAGTYTWVTPVVPPDVCYHPPLGGDVPLLFQDVFSASTDLLFYCRKNVTPPAAAVVVPIKRTYIVINDAQLLRVDGNHALPTYSLSLNIDMDSWTWGFTASLPASALSLVEPDSAGDPVLLKAVINGASYLLLAESIQRDRTFGTSRISVAGRGRSAMLAEPYSPLLTFANSQARTAQQLMADALTINGTSIGWDIDWRITDWLVPAGAWNHQGSYMSAVNAIAAAAGAFIQPDPVNQILRVRPRYPVAPWDWYGQTVTPDLELPAAIITKEGIAWTEKPQYNAVYVSGATAGGILGHVKRSGSAGDNAAPMITDALITHTDAARQRGLNVLADTGRIATYTLSLPVLPETGIIDPGTLVRYVDNGNPTVGVVKGVSVTVGLPKVQQTIEVQTHG